MCVIMCECDECQVIWTDPIHIQNRQTEELRVIENYLVNVYNNKLVECTAESELCHNKEESNSYCERYSKFLKQIWSRHESNLYRLFIIQFGKFVSFAQLSTALQLRYF